MKTWVEPFQAIWDDMKMYEIRYDDRGFDLDNILHLWEWDKHEEVYTGRRVVARVTHISRSPDWGLPSSMVVMSLKILAKFESPPRIFRTGIPDMTDRGWSSVRSALGV